MFPVPGLETVRHDAGRSGPGCGRSMAIGSRERKTVEVFFFLRKTWGNMAYMGDELAKSWDFAYFYLVRICGRKTCIRYTSASIGHTRTGIDWLVLIVFHNYISICSFSAGYR